MRFLTDLPGGWSLHYEDGPIEFGGIVPMMVNTNGRRRRPSEVAMLPEGREVFRCVKTWLDDADQRMAYGAQSQASWKAADKAKLAMQLALEMVGHWDDSLLETPVEA